MLLPLGFLSRGVEIIRSFRRARFNWPLEVVDPFEDDPTNSNAYAYGASTSPTMLTASVIPLPTSSNPEVPIISLTQSISATGSIHTNSSPIPPSKAHVASVFETNKTKALRPTKSNTFLRPSSPLGKLPQRRYDTMKAGSKSKPATPQSTSDVDLSRTHWDNRSGSVTPTPLPSRSSTPTHSSKGSSAEKLVSAITESFATYQREPVHIRTIRVFEAVKES